MEELAREVVAPPADLHLAPPLALDRIEVAPDIAEHMRHIGGRSDGRDRGDPARADHPRRRQHRRPAQAVSDQQQPVAEAPAQELRAFDQVLDIAGEPRTSEIAAAATEAREVEPQRRDPLPRQRARHRDGSLALARAGEAVGIDRSAAHQPGGQFERACQLVPAGGGN